MVPPYNPWWERHCKKLIRHALQYEESERKRYVRNMKNHYYECMYDIVKTATTFPSSISNLKHFKAKIVRLHYQQLQSTMYDTAPADCLLGEHHTFYQLVRRHRRRSSRLVRSVRDSDGIIHTSVMGIATTFTTFLRTKYTNIDADPESIRILAQLIPDTVPHDHMTNDLETPFTITEMHSAISSGGPNRAPGRDGLGIEFYKKKTWAFIQDDLCSILNAMFLRVISPLNIRLGS